MVARDLFDLLDRFCPNRLSGVEDNSDKLNFLYSVILLTLCSLIVSVKCYVIRSIACYLSLEPSGGDFESYMENYCWIYTTIPVPNENRLPEDPIKWDLTKHQTGINYYQWVPFVLGLQAILFYLPRIIWQFLTFNQGGGTDVDQIIKQSVAITEKLHSERTDEYKSIANILMDTIYLHREYKLNQRIPLHRRIIGKFSFLIPSTRRGTKLFFWYLVIKIIYCSNCILQLYLMHRFLGLDHLLLELLGIVNSKFNQNEASFRLLEKYFPRIVYCNVENIRYAGGSNNYVAQCILPANMLNEKIYIFLWFWISFVAVATVVSIISWILCSLHDFHQMYLVKKYLKMHNNYNSEDKRFLSIFINEFLSYDGIFILRMITHNAGDVVSSYVTNEMWILFIASYRGDNRLTPSYNLEVKFNNNNVRSDVNLTEENFFL